MKAFILLITCAAAFAKPLTIREGEELRFHEATELNLSDANIRGAIFCDADLIINCENELQIGSTGSIQAKNLQLKSAKSPNLQGSVTCDRLSLCMDYGKIDLKSAKLNYSHLTIDPKNIIIEPAGTDPAQDYLFATTPSADVTIDGADLATLLDTSPVILQANTDITMNDNIVPSSGSNSLTLQAGRSIAIVEDCSIELTGGDLIITINDGTADGGNRDSGDAILELGGNCTLTTSGGDITMSVGTFGGGQSGQVGMYQATVDAQGGNISMEGFGADQNAAYGFSMIDSTIATTGTGTVTLTGTGRNTGSKCYGLFIAGMKTATSVSSQNGKITLIGNGGGDTVAGKTFNHGLNLINANISTSGTGDIELDGTGGNGEDRNMGTFLTSNTLVQASAGDITLKGQGGGSETFNCGVRIEVGAAVRTTSTGNISTGICQGGGSTNTNFGCSIAGGNLSVVDGAINLTGTGNGTQDWNNGFIIESGSSITSTGTGTITITGNASSNGVDAGMGVRLSGKNTLITSANGDITITGTGHGTGKLNTGVYMESISSVTSTGTGAGASNIVITGTGGLGPEQNYGMYVGSDAAVTSVDGDVTLTGNSSVVGTDGLLVKGDVSSSGTGTVTENDVPPP